MRAIVCMKTDSKSEHITAVGILFATAVLWSFGGVLIKLIAWNPMAIAGGRSALAAGGLLFVVRRDRDITVYNAFFHIACMIVALRR